MAGHTIGQCLHVGSVRAVGFSDRWSSRRITNFPTQVYFPSFVQKTYPGYIWYAIPYLSVPCTTRSKTLRVKSVVMLEQALYHSLGLSPGSWGLKAIDTIGTHKIEQKTSSDDLIWCDHIQKLQTLPCPIHGDEHRKKVFSRQLWHNNKRLERCQFWGKPLLNRYNLVLSIIIIANIPDRLELYGSHMSSLPM